MRSLAVILPGALCAAAASREAPLTDLLHSLAKGLASQPGKFASQNLALPVPEIPSYHGHGHRDDSHQKAQHQKKVVMDPNCGFEWAYPSYEIRCLDAGMSCDQLCGSYDEYCSDDDQIWLDSNPFACQCLIQRWEGTQQAVPMQRDDDLPPGCYSNEEVAIFNPGRKKEPVGCAIDGVESEFCGKRLCMCRSWVIL